MGLANFITSLAYPGGFTPDPPDPPEPPAAVGEMIAYALSPSNKFVDVYFDRGVYGEGLVALTTSEFQITDFVAGGVTVISIASVKKPNHHVAASATALAGGESIVRFFLTLTGTPNSTESFRIKPVADSIFDADGGIMADTQSTGTITLNITPFTLWDAEEASTVTVTGLGISAMADIMGNINLAQTTDADRPKHHLSSVAQFDRTQTEWLVGATHANFAKQNAGDFAVVIKDLRVNLTTNSGFIIGYMTPSGNNGWTVRGGGGAQGINAFMSDNVSSKFPITGNHEDQVGNYIVQNEGGVITIYDEDNNILATSSTALAAISYGTVTGVFVGRRDNIASNEFNGEWAKLIYYNQALSSAARVNIFKNLNINKAVLSATVTKYLYPLLNGSTNSSAKDTMQVFLGDILSRAGVQHLFYVGNAADGDVDRVFKATRADDDSNTPFVKTLNAGLPKVILDRSNVNGTYDENQVFVRDVFWDETEGHAKMYFSAEQTGASPMYTTGLATSTDLETWTKYGQIYTDGTNSIIFHCVVKIAPGVYHGVISKTAAGVGGETNAFSYDHITSANGISWSAPTNINSLFKNTVLFLKLLYWNGKFYGVLNGTDRDTNLSVSQDILIYEISNDFTTSIYLGKLLTNTGPSERGLGSIAFSQKTDHIEIFCTYSKNQDKANSDGGEGFSAIRRSVLTGTTLKQSNVVEQYPSWVKRYYPLDDRHIRNNKFLEIITGIESATYATPQFSLDGRRFLDVLTSGPVFTDNYSDIDLTDITISCKAEIVASGTIVLYKKGTDVLIQLVTGKLEVWLNNGQKRYITSAVVAMPTGITEFGSRVRMGFSLVAGVMKLIVGNNTDITNVKTVDNVITALANTTNTIEIAPASIVEIRSILVQSGQTDQQWIDTDL